MARFFVQVLRKSFSHPRFFLLLAPFSLAWVAAALMLTVPMVQSAPDVQSAPVQPPQRAFSQTGVPGFIAHESAVSMADRAAVDAALLGQPAADAPAQAQSQPAQITSAAVPVTFDPGAFVLEGRLTLSPEGSGSYTSPSITVPLEGAAPFLGIGTLWQIDNSALFNAAAIAVNVRGSVDGTVWTPWRHYEEYNLTDGGVASGLMTLEAATRFVQFQIIWDGGRLAGEMTFSGGSVVFISPGSTPPAQAAQIAAAADSGQPVAPDLVTGQAYSPPAVISRTAWGCPQGQSSPAWPPVYRTVTHVIIHHTVTENTSSDWAAVVRSIWQFHTFNNGWGDIGYNFLIDPNGVVYEGRAGGDRAVGGHFCGQNNGTLGVAMIGTFTSARPTQRALNALNNLLAWKMDAFNIDPTARSYHASSTLNLYNISGHRDGCQTACPGSGMYGVIPSVRSNVSTLIGGGTRPGMPIILAPEEGGSVPIPFDVVLQPGQTNATRAYDFQVQLDNNADFSSPEFDNVALNGAWSRNTSIGIIGSLSPGTYYLRARQGDTVSRASDWTPTVRITLRTAPTNDPFANAAVVPTIPYRVTQDVFGSTVSATDPTPSSACSTGGRQNTVWFRYVPSIAQIVRLTTEGSSYDTVLGVYTGREGALTEIACHDDLTSEIKTSALSFLAAPGTPYYVMVAKWGSSALAASATLALNVSAPGNDLFANGYTISTAQAAYTYDLFGGSVSDSDPGLSCLGGAKDYANSVWYRLTPSSSGPVTLATPGIGIDTVIAVFTGGEGALSEVACNDNYGTAPGSLIRLNAAAGTTYYILAARKGSSAVTAPTYLSLQVNIPTALAPGAVASVTFGNPTFVWADLGVPYYYFYIQTTAGQQIVNEVVTRSAANCDGLVCQLDPTTLREAYRLSDGSYNLYLNTWANGAYGLVTGPFPFTVDAPPPALVTMDTAQNTITLRPTLRWSLNSAPARNATSFNLYVAPASNIAAGVYFQNHTRIAACGGLSGTACAVTLPVDLTSGTTYHAFVQSCGAGGCTITSGPYNNGFAGPSVFTISVPVPALPTNLAADYGYGFPTLRWSDDASATAYNVYIGKYPSWEYVFFQQVPRTSGASGLCEAGTCRMTIPAAMPNGAYSFAVQGVGPSGVSRGGRYNNGYGVLENRPLALPVPEAPLGLLAPEGEIITGNPTLRWETVANATSYYVWVGTTTNGYVAWYYQQHPATAPLCTPHTEAAPGTCELSLSLNLPTGAFAWNVLAVGPGGQAPWAEGRYFTVVGTRPGTVTLLQPTGTTPTYAPTFAWADMDGVESYAVWIGNPQVTTTLHYKTYARSALCSEGLCRLSVPELIFANGSYLWNAQAINPAGAGDWTQTGMAFTIMVAPPVAPVLVSPADDAILHRTNRPTLVWDTVPDSQGYLLQVVNSLGADVYSVVHYSSDPGCSAARCAITLPNPIPYGAYRWRVTPGNLNGAGAATDFRDFFSLSFNTEPLVADVDDALVEQNGDWEAAYDQHAHEGDYLVSSEIGDALSLTFTGTQVDIFYVAGPQFGTFAVEIDGVTLLTVDAAASDLRAGQIASVRDLLPGEHRLRIFAQEAAEIAIDAVGVDGEIIAGLLPTPTPTPSVTPTAAVTGGAPPPTRTPEGTAESTAPPTPAGTPETTPEPSIPPTLEATPEATSALTPTPEATDPAPESTAAP